MDSVTRGHLETELDKYLETCGVVPEEIDSIIELLPTSSRRTLVLGYHIGRLVAIVDRHLQGLHYKTPDWIEARKEAVKLMISRRVPDLSKRIEQELHR